MSRICVKNLPKYATKESLKEFFTFGEEPTDVKLARTDKGISRQFGFIGYRTEKQAEEAIRRFNKSYFDTSRIICEAAYVVGDPNIPRPWSRHSSIKDSKTDKSNKKAADVKNSKTAALKKEKPKRSCDVDDPQLIEYLEAVQPRVKSKLWGNDSSILLTHKDDNNKKKIVEDSAPLSAESDEDDCPENGPSDNAQSLASNDVLTDMDYFKSKVKKKWSDSDSSDSDDDGNDANSPSNEKLKAREEVPNGELDDFEKDVSKRGSQNDPASEEEKEAIQTSRLFVHNLVYTTTEEELEEHFGKIGTVSEVHLVKDKGLRMSKGYAYIRYTHPEFAARALEELDNSPFQGRLLHVMPAEEKPEKLEDSTIAKTFKQQIEEKRKASEASGDTKAWNPFFMRPDTVVESIAMKLGVSKAAFLNTEANDLAVRLALGETQVIKNTKESLRKAGVNVESLEEFASDQSNSAKRSNHILLVKNLPHGTSNRELTEMFGKFGNLEKIILPPTKTLALAVFIEPGEARAAYKGLSYKRYKDAPLYLEWAPANILSSEGKEKSSAVGEEGVKQVKAVKNLELEAIFEDADPDRVESRSLYVKNLNFKTSEESLKTHFVEHMKTGKISSAKIVMHKKHGKDVSKGYGFLEFDSMETAVTVCKDLQGTVLDGHAVILEPKSQMKVDKPVPKRSESDKSSTKLIVRNVPFQATEKDLRKLFASFGQLKSVRLPVKMFGGHKGFAFVEFVTKQETQAAMQALSSTHLYGRRLVLERANENETLEQLQARTAAHFVDEELGFRNQAKLSRKRKNTEASGERKIKFR